MLPVLLLCTGISCWYNIVSISLLTLPFSLTLFLFVWILLPSHWPSRCQDIPLQPLAAKVIWIWQPWSSLAGGWLTEKKVPITLNLQFVTYNTVEVVKWVGAGILVNVKKKCVSINPWSVCCFGRMKVLIDEHSSEAEAMLRNLDSKSFPEVIVQLITLKK